MVTSEVTNARKAERRHAPGSSRLGAWFDAQLSMNAHGIHNYADVMLAVCIVYDCIVVLLSTIILHPGVLCIAP